MSESSSAHIYMNYLCIKGHRSDCDYIYLAESFETLLIIRCIREHRTVKKVHE